MNNNYLALIVDRECKKRFINIKKELYKEHLDETLYTLPPIIILGKTDRNSFERGYFKTSIRFKTQTIKHDSFHILPIEEDELFTKFINELNISNSIPGMYVSSKYDYTLNEALTSSSSHLALIKPYLDGYLIVQ